MLQKLYVLFFLLLIQTPFVYAQPKEPSSISNDILILYDSVGETGWVGYLNSLFLANLIGHFNLLITRHPIDQYKTNELEKYHTTFYLGSHYNNPLPSFINDTLHTNRTIVWFRYNFEQLTQASPQFSNQYGFTFDGIDNTGYDSIIYKKTLLSKELLDPHVGHITINNPLLAISLATARQTETGSTIPYVVHSSNLWYVADVPFTYLSENDRYLAFADLLYDILDVKDVVDTKRAILRLEDIHPNYDNTILRKIADYLFSQNVPFAISVIPVYADPLGYYTNGVPKYISIVDSPNFIRTLKYMESKGGTIILHGYSHQYSNVKNSLSGVSGHDYEFFKVTLDPATLSITSFEPLDEDSEAWIDEKITAARSLLSVSDLTTDIWETPHYLASVLDNQYFAKHFSAIIGRENYFYPINTQHNAEQFFPYIINKDHYGAKVIPENLGCVLPANGLGFPIRTVEDLLLTAKKNLVIRDAWASMYYHPYLGLDYLQQLIPGIRALGYEFVPVSPELT